MQPVPYYVGALHAMIEIGVDLARRCEQAADFERISRSVRRSIMLAHKLAQPAANEAEPDVHREGARKQIIRRVEDAIQREAAPGQADGLHGELLERLDSPELEDDIGSRPVDDIVADICRDLGIAAAPGTQPWKRRTPRDVALLCGRAAARGDAGNGILRGRGQGSALDPPKDGRPLETCFGRLLFDAQT